MATKLETVDTISECLQSKRVRAVILLDRTIVSNIRVYCALTRVISYKIINH